MSLDGWTEPEAGDVNLSALIVELEEVYGPVPDELVAEARRAWPDVQCTEPDDDQS
jgi:hypothetical protein